ncbi:MAG TPA: energy transducer TonB [Phenylobacterium sp.]|uniref:energy transducer TonB n=1 Tax=Phenylobacterium sp. TaxID=1871053 RepID=UPI002D51C5B4|nr:energy transducer TonB [Phenylobacterium sp.]HZZ69621.1 energy transducer TonB [Phenylobacterium sp.]
MGMEFLILAAALAAPPPAGPSQTPTPPAAAEGGQTKTVSPVTVSPLTKPPPADLKLKMAGSDDDIDQLVTIWPEGARQTGRNGKVTLRCQIDVHGLAESCDVVYEDPKDQGFGRVALKLRHTIKLPPAQGPDGPVSALKNIQVTFTAPTLICTLAEMMDGTPGCSNPRPLHKATEIVDPLWTQAASFDDLAAAYPAKAGGEEGYAAVRCRVRRDGGMEGCEIIKEEPDGKGFGRAALHLAAARFRVDPKLAAHQVNPVLVDVPIRFPSRQELDQRTVMAPVWLTGFDPKAAPRLFPPEAVAQGLTTGRGVARCTVGPDGALSACAPEPGDPEGLGFSQAAARLATGMRMNLWSADGAPVEGGVVHVPVRLNLKSGG